VVELLVKRVTLGEGWACCRLVGVAPLRFYRASRKLCRLLSRRAWRGNVGEITIFCGIDWAERHHDVAIVDDGARLLARCRISDDAAGLTVLSGLLAEHAGDEATGGCHTGDIALETDCGLLVAALRAAGHRVYAINPMAVDRYRDRHRRAHEVRSGDALVLADLLRTEQDRNRPLPQDSDRVAAIAVPARAHQDAVAAALHEASRLRSLLREFFPAALGRFPRCTPAPR
jgi:transposase